MDIFYVNVFILMIYFDDRNILIFCKKIVQMPRHLQRLKK